MDSIPDTGNNRSTAPPATAQPPQPPRRNHPGLLVALVGVLVVALGFGARWFFGRNDQQTTAPPRPPHGRSVPGTQQDHGSSPAKKPSTSPLTRRNTGGQTPDFPKSFGEFEARQEFSGKNVAHWTQDMSKLLSVSADSCFTPEEEIQELPGTQVFGDLTCGNYYPAPRTRRQQTRHAGGHHDDDRPAARSRREHQGLPGCLELTFPATTPLVPVFRPRPASPQ